MTPRYSFIIPAYNEEALIAQTLDMLRASAASLTGGFEMIVANDASTDRTPEIAREKGARVIDVKKRQIAAVRNAGAAVANALFALTGKRIRHMPFAPERVRGLLAS